MASPNIIEEAKIVNEGLRHLCFDIETGYAAPEDIEKMSQDWKAPANIKDADKIAEKFKAFQAEAKLKSALLDRAPITVLAIVTESVRVVWSCIQDPCPVKRMPGVDAEIRNFANEREMLIDLREWLGKNTSPRTVVIGFNCLGFDLPKLRNAYIRHKLALPGILLAEVNAVYDVMKKFTRSFSTEFSNEHYVKLKVVQSRLGLPEYKEAISGADAPRLAAEGKSKLVIPYCYLDTVTTYMAFLYMTGQMPDQEIPQEQ